MQYIICHYSEIGLKGKNRKFFEEKLIENIKKKISRDLIQYIKRISGRIFIQLKDLTKEQEREIKERLEKIFGLAYFCFAQESKQELKAIQENGRNLLKEKNFNSFCVRVQRSNKNFPLTSVEVERRVGGFLAKSLKKKIDLTNPEIILFIEIVEKYVFLYTKKITGLGGLPVGSSGKAICFLLNDINSLVAAWQMMKRGMEIIFVYFFCFKNKDNFSKRIKKIVAILNQYQSQSKLYIIPFKKIQREIFKAEKDKYYYLICKRAMFKIGEIIAKKENCSTLIVGDNSEQALFQTLDNVNVIGEEKKLLILRPLTGLFKQEIIEVAKKIKIYNLSITSNKFCCCDCLPESQVVNNFKVIQNIEKKININKFIRKITNEAKVEKF